ncbi:hypothetical protein Nepgr_013127 [Nepenthes gracilis]|uniref:Beta-catenin-like protein 1 N-terminal domain-containing protein n=1 Tax=Nepenthes gracilis TaxID=150966 RepID=A0AAD3SID3_NEPGR|nr:hypothetical protein Nepgr_013127 [Nepenthes gracilis]
MEVANAGNLHSLKRRREDDGVDNDDEDYDYPLPQSNGNTTDVDLSLLEEVEKSQNAVEVLDVKTLKKLVLSFERRLRDNIEARLKYPDQPEKFADSEVELHEELQKLKLLAGGPELYPELVNLNAIPSILGLLHHDNTDIAIDVVSLLQDLTDEDVLEDNDEPARILVDSLVENNALELLVQNLFRLNEADSDEMAAAYNTLATIENLIEVKPAVSEIVCEKTKLMRWLLGKIKVREFDGNKQYASEILAILLQNSSANQKRLGQMNGVDVVLQAVAMYKSKDPKSSDEEEMLENLFDCLCCLLMPLENKERFVKAEGVELMIIIIKQKKSAYGSAIRALDFAMTKYPPACERFVDVLGLKTAFAAFMGKIPISKKNKKERYQEDIEERIVSIIASLFGGILRGSRRERLLSKFVENECEKIDRLMELYVRYSDRLKAEIKRLDQLDLDDLEMDEEERYNRKLESGLYILQLIAVILAHLWSSEHLRMRARIELLLKQHKLTRKDIKDILQEYHDNIGDLDGPEEKEKAQAKPGVGVFVQLGVEVSTGREGKLDTRVYSVGTTMQEIPVFLDTEVTIRASAPPKFVLIPSLFPSPRDRKLALAAMAKSFVSIFLIFSFLLLASSVNARPGLHFHPCKTLLVTTYSFSFRPRNPHLSTHHLPHDRPEFLSLVAEGRRFDPKPEEPLFLEHPRFVFDKIDIDRPNPKSSPLGVSSLRDRSMDILNVVASLLFGAVCGALTAGAMYFIWSLFINRRDDGYSNFDSFTNDDDNDDIFNPKKPTGYVAVPAAPAADTAAAPAPP